MKPLRPLLRWYFQRLYPDFKHNFFQEQLSMAAPIASFFSDILLTYVKNLCAIREKLFEKYLTKLRKRTISFPSTITALDHNLSKCSGDA